MSRSMLLERKNKYTMNAVEPLPRVTNFEKLAYGMFIHWGLYSLLGEGEWAQAVLHRLPVSEYAKLRERFTASDFNAREIARLARRVGMRYIVLTARHHEGFSLYDTRGLSDHDAPHSAAGRDLVGEFVDGCRLEGIMPFLYHTTLDWNHPAYQSDFNGYLDYLHDSIEILCTRYGEIGGFWFDGNWDKPDADWKEARLYGMIRQHQPDAIIINNTGINALGHLGHPEIDAVTFEQSRAKPMDRTGMSKYLSAEMCQTLNRHWGIARNDFNYLSMGAVIENLCACRKVGANYILNVGATAEGKIPDFEAAFLLRMGEWVHMHEKALRTGKPCGVQGKGADFALEAEGRIFLFVHNLPAFTNSCAHNEPRAFNGLARRIQSLRWLDNGENLAFSQNTDSGVFSFNATGYAYGTHLVVRVAEVLLHDN